MFGLVVAQSFVQRLKSAQEQRLVQEAWSQKAFRREFLPPEIRVG
jgi:hypothetical protein